MRGQAINIVIGAALGGLFIATGSYVSARWNDAVVWSDVRAVVVLHARGNEEWLAVRYHVAQERNCPSWTQHVVYRDNRLGSGMQRDFVPLAITANGLGAATDARDFAIDFRLPANLLPGTWYYTAITSASCEWLPGLQRESVSQTQPVRIEVP